MTQTDQPSADHRPAYLRGHVPVLDGVRGIAILLVVVFHTTAKLREPAAGFDWWVWQVFRTGWMGVDLFFVLSGYLITGILCDTRNAKNYYKSFYGRRALRIFPLYYTFLIVLLIVRTLAHPDRPPFPAPALWYFLYLQNWLILPNDIFILGVTWSLAAEEQFYLIWPTLTRKLGQARMLKACIAIVALSPVLRAALYYLVDESWGSHAYKTTITRLDALAVGALIALVIRRPGGIVRLRSWAKWVFPAAVAGLLACFAMTGDADPRAVPFSIYGFSFVALLGGVFLVLVLQADPDSRMTRILSGKFLKTWGKYSYAVYLLHAPAIMLVSWRVLGFLWTDRTLPGIAGSQIPVLLVVIASVAAAALGFAWLSWHLVEKRFLALKSRFEATR